MVDDALKDGRTKAWIERILEKRRSNDKKTDQDRNQDSSSQRTLSSTTVADTQTRIQFSIADGKFRSFYLCTISISAATWNLQGSWILDNGTNVHL